MTIAELASKCVWIYLFVISRLWQQSQCVMNGRWNIDNTAIFPKPYSYRGFVTTVSTYKASLHQILTMVRNNSHLNRGWRAEVCACHAFDWSKYCFTCWKVRETIRTIAKMAYIIVFSISNILAHSQALGVLEHIPLTNLITINIAIWLLV